MKEHTYFSEDHPSYRNHRRQFWWQILLPVFLVALLVIAVAVFAGLAAFGKSDVSPRWAAISTIWLVIPTMGFGLLFLFVLASLIYLLARALQAIPPYSAKAQYYVKRVAIKTRRISDLAVRPILFLDSIAASLKAITGRR